MNFQMVILLHLRDLYIVNQSSLWSISKKFFNLHIWFPHASNGVKHFQHSQKLTLKAFTIFDQFDQLFISLFIQS